ncbi:hypothetical protein Csa_006388 [Cucumis sativus]|uniref:Uncharacterized protein n=1 Tax=Cucumis sativus TaxID=3659 RepID=A0A0A0LMZ7_CUCSA|nr:hypothetical protein Csa_006388 [Cucumis sativus]
MFLFGCMMSIYTGRGGGGGGGEYLIESATWSLSTIRFGYNVAREGRGSPTTWPSHVPVSVTSKSLVLIGSLRDGPMGSCHGDTTLGSWRCGESRPKWTRVWLERRVHGTSCT